MYVYKHGKNLKFLVNIHRMWLCIIVFTIYFFLSYLPVQSVSKRSSLCFLYHCEHEYILYIYEQSVYNHTELQPDLSHVTAQQMRGRKKTVHYIRIIVSEVCFGDLCDIGAVEAVFEFYVFNEYHEQLLFQGFGNAMEI